MRLGSVIALVLTLVVVAPALAQNGGGFGRGGGGMRGGDPNEFFNRLSNGKDVWIRSEITDERAQRMFDRIAERLGVSNGQITREQFVNARNMRGQQRPGPGNTSPQPAAVPGNPPAQGSNPDAWTGWAERMFQRLDLNGDGYLNNDEMPEELRAQRDKWDADKNGLIDLNEFKAYFQARMQERMAERGAGGSPDQAPTPIIIVPEAPAEEEKKAPVYHAGNLPKELPAWFGQLDTDNDGQIGLYEWKASGRPIEDFLKMDRNGDGFLTVQEVLAYETQQKKKGRTALAQAGVGGRRGGGPGADQRPGR